MTDFRFGAPGTLFFRPHLSRRDGPGRTSDHPDAGREVSGGTNADGTANPIAVGERIQWIEDAIAWAAGPRDCVAH